MFLDRTHSLGQSYKYSPVILRNTTRYTSIYVCQQHVDVFYMTERCIHLDESATRTLQFASLLWNVNPKSFHVNSSQILVNDDSNVLHRARLHACHLHEDLDLSLVGGGAVRGKQRITQRFHTESELHA